MPTFSLSYPSDEFSLSLCVSSGQAFRWQQLEDGRWLGVDGEHWYLVEIEGDDHRVESNATESNFVSLFRLDYDLKEVEAEIVARGPELEPYIGNLRGLRVMRPSDPHEVLFCFLCTANNHMSRIIQMVRRLAAYGEPLDEVAGHHLTRFPSANKIAGITEQELRDLGFGYRGRTIPKVAHQILMKPDGWLESLVNNDDLPSNPKSAIPNLAAEGDGDAQNQPLDPATRPSAGQPAERPNPQSAIQNPKSDDTADRLHALDSDLASTPTYKGAWEELMTLDSIGPKLSDCIALFGLHHLEAAPIDTHLWQAACRLYFPEWKDKAVTDSRYRQLGDFLRERFGDLTGWAHQYLFYDNLLNWRSRA